MASPKLGDLVTDLGRAWRLAEHRLRSELEKSIERLAGEEARKIGAEAARELAVSIRLVQMGEIDPDVADARRKRSLDALKALANAATEVATKESIATATKWLTVAGEVGIGLQNRLWWP